jgi:hypothetical protein
MAMALDEPPLIVRVPESKEAGNVFRNPLAASNNKPDKRWGGGLG